MNSREALQKTFYYVPLLPLTKLLLKLVLSIPIRKTKQIKKKKTQI